MVKNRTGFDYDYMCSYDCGFVTGSRQGEEDELKGVCGYPDGPNDTEFAKGWTDGYKSTNKFARESN